MNNFKKIGLTALAGSLVATSVYAGEMSVNGNASVHMNINAGHDSSGAGDFTAGRATDENGFGNFQHAPPSGFLALCSANLPTAESIDPAETDDNFPQKLFKTVLYTNSLFRAYNYCSLISNDVTLTISNYAG